MTCGHDGVATEHVDNRLETDQATKKKKTSLRMSRFSHDHKWSMDDKHELESMANLTMIKN